MDISPAPEVVQLLRVLRDKHLPWKGTWDRLCSMESGEVGQEERGVQLVLFRRLLSLFKCIYLFLFFFQFIYLFLLFFQFCSFPFSPPRPSPWPIRSHPPFLFRKGGLPGISTKLAMTAYQVAIRLGSSLILRVGEKRLQKAGKRVKDSLCSYC